MEQLAYEASNALSDQVHATLLGTMKVIFKHMSALTLPSGFMEFLRALGLWSDVFNDIESAVVDVKRLDKCGTKFLKPVGHLVKVVLRYILQDVARLDKLLGLPMPV